MTYPPTIPLTSIIIDPARQRTDLGDLTDDTESIEEIGLIQPIVLVQKVDGFHLVAGERRLTICRNLGYEFLTHGLTCVPGTPGYTCLEECDQDTLEQIEYDENCRRKDITWQEKTLAIARRHESFKTKAIQNGKPWFNRETGKLLGVSAAWVDFVLIVAERLRANDDEIVKCDGGVYEAIRILTKRKEVEAEKVKMSLAVKQMPHITVQPSSLDGQEELLLVASRTATIEIDTRCFNAKFEDWSKLQPSASYNHIITDPPYAIDMEYLEQGGMGMSIGDVARTHDVDANLNDMPLWLSECYRLLDPNGFCVWWCDMMVWQYLYDLATLNGFAVQRWPIVWNKTSPCQNGSAQYNFTKKTEIAMVMRKKGATLANAGAAITNVLTHSASTEQARFGHPFAKPLQLHKDLFNAICLKGQTILDPFAGRGTLAVAAIEWGLQPTSIEVETDLHFSHLQQNVRAAYQAKLGATTEILFK